MILAILSVGFWVQSCSSKNSSLDCPEGFEKVENEDFSFCYPEDWELDQNGVLGSLALVKSKETRESERGTLFAMNVNLMRQSREELDIAGLRGLDQIATFNRQQIGQILFKSEILNFKKTKINGRDAYRNTMTAEPNGSSLFFEQVFMLNENGLYVLTFTCLQSESQENKDLGKKIMETLLIQD